MGLLQSRPAIRSRRVLKAERAWPAEDQAEAEKICERLHSSRLSKNTNGVSNACEPLHSEPVSLIGQTCASLAGACPYTVPQTIIGVVTPSIVIVTPET
jgi:hypothetical protein